MVIRAMAKWPDVPDVFGWLSLDRRGRWLLQGEPILNRAAVAFVNRNYAADEQGRWFFQNGPQRVFVQLAYTPWIYRTTRSGACQTHTGLVTGPPRAVFLDQQGNLLLLAEPGVGLVDDRDLAELSECIRTRGGEPLSEEILADLLGADLLGQVAQGAQEVDKTGEKRGPANETGLVLSWGGERLDVHFTDAINLASRFGFVQEPA